MKHNSGDSIRYRRYTWSSWEDGIICGHIYWPGMGLQYYLLREGEPEPILVWASSIENA